MKRSLAETVLGLVVVLIAGTFLWYSLETADISTAPDGYNITADFAGVGGLKAGDKVQISGVKVGSVTRVELLNDSYLARVHMNIKNQYQVPLDTAALISSEGLLGGQYLALEPGADEEMIEADGEIEYTQAPKNLEQLLGDFIFSIQDKNDEEPTDESEE